MIAQENNTLFSKVLADIGRCKSNRINFIPFSNFKRFSSDYCGILKDDYTIITSGSGTGKSKFMFSQYILEPIKYIINNDFNDVDVKIFLNSLEEPADKIIYNLICTLLYQHGIYVDIRQLKGIPNTDSLTDELITKIKSLQPFFNMLESKVEISSFNHTAKSIYERTKNYLIKQDIGKVITNSSGNQEYVPKNPNLFTIHITDHIGLITPSKEEGTTFNAIERHSTYNNLTLKNLYKCQVVDVQQQTALSETLDFNYKGVLNEQKLKPSRDGLQYHKNTFNNASFVLGLFAPFRHKIEEYNGYNLSLLQDSYRYLEILKAREGTLCGIDLFYKGAIGEFEEIPSIMSNKDYSYYCGIMDKYKALVPDKKKEERQETIYSL